MAALLSLTAIGASAVETVVKVDTSALGTGVSPGDTIFVPVTISGNPGFASVARLLVHADAGLTFTGAAAGVVCPGAPVVNAPEGKIEISGASNVMGDGTVITLSFTVDSDATAGEKTISLDEGTVFADENGDFITKTLVFGTVRVNGDTPPTPNESDYEVALRADKTAVGTAGAVTVDVLVSGKAFNGFEINVSYETDKFAFASYSSEINGVAVTDNHGALLVKLLNSAAAVSSGRENKVASLVFTAKKVTADTDTPFRIVSGYISDWEAAAGRVVPSVVNDGAAVVRVLSTNVTLVENYTAGYTLVKVEARGDAAYAYDGHSMYAYTGAAGSWNLYLVAGAADAGKVAASAAPAAGTVTRSGDVNGSEKIDFYDAMAVFGVFNSKYDVDGHMLLWLNADVTGDDQVGSLDVQTVFNNPNYNR